MLAELALLFDVELPGPGGDAFLERSAILPSTSASGPCPAVLVEEGEVLLAMLGVSEFGAAMSIGSPVAAGAGDMAWEEIATGAREVVFEMGTRRAPINLSWPSDIRIDVGELLVEVAICPKAMAVSRTRGKT